jgi:hypothetical protein
MEVTYRRPPWLSGSYRTRCKWVGMNTIFIYLFGPSGGASPGRSSHSDTTLYILVVIICTKRTGRRQNDFNFHA